MKVGKEGKYRQVFWNEVGLERGGKQVDQGESSFSGRVGWARVERNGESWETRS